MLYRVHDRQFGGFADAPPDDKLTLAEAVAWDVHAVGRNERDGLSAVGEIERHPHQRCRLPGAFWALDGD